MRIITFIFEFISYIFVMRYAVGVSFTYSKIRHVLAAVVIFVWGVLTLGFSVFVPYTFIILLLIPIIFAEKWYRLLLVEIFYTLILNIMSNTINFLAFFITRDQDIYSGNIVRCLNLLLLIGWSSDWLCFL
jgi:hypothetical protein